jgi:hypothetical protein
MFQDLEGTDDIDELFVMMPISPWTLLQSTDKSEAVDAIPHRGW